MQDSDARIILDEVASTRRALIKVMRELESIKANGKHAEALITATRAEVAEARAIFRNAEAHAKGEESPITRLIQTVGYRHPKPSTQTFSKDAPGKPRVFINNKEVTGGRIEHVTRAKDVITGALIELPCGYDQAHKFLSMETPNRRKHWRGNRVLYGAMLALALRIGFIEQRGRAYVWAEKFDLWARLEWLGQFRPPGRVR